MKYIVPQGMFYYDKEFIFTIYGIIKIGAILLHSEGDME
ncbi:hypothetical protein SAMD00020551_2542 [Mesobacillus selenatarsenatis SF-1]|uniref:Uncharacterized protein n=1 Tax=Mesobacillus selenatarsenatis (strain DSM 18680 / JCM 14380 / FERM P-15431 / SF-1) TaxID=1321606 RepID=A0A0A8X3C5_MESS1|nr:hypothetical protein SAMD00020551_2542 [Mesobacillus selenatarsenatis SF-1]